MSKKILITGACGGIGSSLTKKLAAEGHHIIAVDLKAFKNSSHLKISSYIFDLAKTEEITGLCETILKEHGPIDILINNAGIAHIKGFLEEGLERFNLAMKINFEAAVVLSYFWLPHLEKNGGMLVNIASIAGLVAPACMSSYTSSKFALVGFSRCLQGELAARSSQASVLLVSPGFVETPIMKIGQKDGLPDILKYITTSPDSCALEIIAAIHKKKKFITPGISGKAMAIINTVAPGLFNFINITMVKKLLLSDGDKK